MSPVKKKPQILNPIQDVGTQVKSGKMSLDEVWPALGLVLYTLNPSGRHPVNLGELSDILDIIFACIQRAGADGCIQKGCLVVPASTSSSRISTSPDEAELGYDVPKVGSIWEYRASNRRVEVEDVMISRSLADPSGEKEVSIKVHDIYAGGQSELIPIESFVSMYFEVSASSLADTANLKIPRPKNQ